VTLFTWFAETARRHPTLPALEVGEHRLSYAELLDAAERVSTRLLETVGDRPRTVGLLASRSVAAYVGYLAALRLSASVVPLGPEFPVERNRLISAAAAVEVVVADDAGVAAASADAAGDVPVAELSGAWWDGLPGRCEHTYPAGPAGVAYTLFTSGSTGIPKGVPIRHGNLATYLQYTVDRYRVGPGSRLSQTFELTFDPSVFDMFVAWCAGAALVVAEPGDLMAPVRFINEKQLTHWFSVPSVVSLARRLRGLRPGCMPNLRWSLFCGEQLTLSQARSWANAAPDSVVENLYGPTELTITCAGYRLPAEQARWPRTSNGTVPIGRVHPHLDAVVLTEDGRETDDGELCVRGEQRFDGYLDTAQNEGRFLRFDGGRVTQVRGAPTADSWYRTGDRVRLEDGGLVHLGRLDSQVKIHGYRIELGEIESVLRCHDRVHDSVVLALPDDRQELGLHALYSGDDVNEAELAELVGARLPAYMAPRCYRHVDRFPLNANGKVDRRRLAAEVGRW